MKASAVTMVSGLSQKNLRQQCDDVLSGEEVGQYIHRQKNHDSRTVTESPIYMSLLF